MDPGRARPPAGISRAAVSAIEIKRIVPSVAAALALASCLGSTVEQLFGPAPRPPDTNGPGPRQLPRAVIGRPRWPGESCVFRVRRRRPASCPTMASLRMSALHRRKVIRVLPTAIRLKRWSWPGAIRRPGFWPRSMRQTGRRMIYLCRSSGRASNCCGTEKFTLPVCIYRPPMDVTATPTWSAGNWEFRRPSCAWLNGRRAWSSRRVSGPGRFVAFCKGRFAGSAASRAQERDSVWMNSSQ